MPQTEGRAWWADVEHLREHFERRREVDDRADARRAIVRRRAHQAALRPPASEFVASVPERARGEARGEGARGVAEAYTPARRPARGVPLTPPPARRTVEITGRPASSPALPRLIEVDRRRPMRRPIETIGPRPDHIAAWAVVLGFILILVALTS
jgi:hypothetical protein